MTSPEDPLPAATGRPFLFFGPLPPPWNGHTLAFSALIEEARRRGKRFSLIDYSPRLKPGPIGAVIRPAEYLLVLARFVRDCLHQRGAIVYLTLNQAVSGVVRDLFLIRVAQLTGHPVVVHLHGGAYGRLLLSLPHRLQQAMVAALADCRTIILLSDRLRPILDSRPELTRLVQVVPNGFAPPRETAPLSPKTLRPGEPLRLLYFSNFHEAKGWWEALETVDRLVNHHQIPVAAHFCGDHEIFPTDRQFHSVAEARAGLERFVAERGLAGSFRRDPFLRGEMKAEALRRAHVLLLPSRNEGMPLSLIEGMAYGCVLLSSPVGAVADLVRPDLNGFLRPPDPEYMADTLALLYADPARFTRLSAGSLDLYEREFTLDRHLDRLFAVLGQEATKG